MLARENDMYELDCQHVSTSESGDEIHQILFEEDHEDEDGSYVLLSRAFLEEEDEGDAAPVYVETHDERLIGHYQTVGAELNRDDLTLTLPAPASQTIRIRFKISEPTFQNVARTLDIILQRKA